MTLSRRGRLGVGLLLAVSLALNLVIAGVVVGRLVSDGPRHHGPHMLRGVPEAARPALRDAFKAHRDDIREHIHGIREARAHIADRIAADPLDEAALEAAFDELARRTDAMQALTHRIVIETAQSLPPDVREGWRAEWGERR
ncbi:periplasmic heavy metal sensor [Spectribacter hydrogenoxidans]|uniref:Signaling pathway modulator ZraP n=1 Tax=Spectribacter hydrogenoxidans TaxID=3075608 RepID=A0ABU3C3S6_9GAMM|nr:periplasmic heavy metal sensor [Salinisphaera sp. W335]MDT0636211.1 periplasmic heavy metal sensor [Salinisphaera sp. W335]